MHSGADGELAFQGKKTLPAKSHFSKLGIKGHFVILILCKTNKLGKIKTHRPSGY